MNSKARKLRVKKLLRTMIQILWDGKITKIDPKVTITCYLIYYFQYLSFILRVSNKRQNSMSSGLNYITTIVEAFSGTPLLGEIGSESFTLGLLFLFSILSILIFLYVLTLTIASSFFDPFSKKISITSQISGINKLIQYYLSFFQWTLYAPLLELFLSVSFSCGDDRAVLPSLRNTNNCNSRTIFLQVFSGISVILNILLGVVNLWAFRTYDFLEKNLLRVKWSMIRLIIFLLRTVLVVLYIFVGLGSRSTLIYILLNFISLITIWEYAINNPIRDIFSANDHFGIIIAFATSVWYWTILEFTNLVDTNTGVYAWLLIIALSWRFGWQFIERSRIKYLSSLDNNGSDVLTSDNLDFAMEELVHYSLNNRFSQQGVFLVNSLIKQHLRLCNVKGCPIKPKYFQNFMECDLQRKMELVSLFVKLAFKQYIKRWHTQRSKHLSKYERISLKYFSFLIFYNGNPIQSVFELHSMSNKNVNHTLYYRICSKLLSKSVRESLSVYEFQQITTNNALNLTSDERNLSVKFFAEMETINRSLISEAQKLVLKKMEFLEAFKNGFSEADTMISMTRNLVKELTSFRHELGKYDRLTKKSSSATGLPKNIFLFKFISLYESILTNNAMAGNLYEDEIEKVRSIERAFDQKGLNLMSILKGDVVILEASYLYPNGKLIKHEREKKFASFFGYEKHEAESIQSVNDLLPQFLRQNHPNIINNYINKTRNLNSRENVKVSSYALNSRGFIFPVSIYPRVNISFSNDFVIQAAVLKMQNHNKIVLTNTSGFILGINTEFMTLFEKGTLTSEELLKPNDLNSLNIFFLMPQLQDQLKKTKQANPNTRDIEIFSGLSDLFVPNNLHDILNSANKRNRTKSMEKGRGLGSESMGNTLAINAFSSKYLLNNGFTQTLTNSDTNHINSLGIEFSECRPFRTEFNLRSHLYSWGTKEKQQLEILAVEITNIHTKNTKWDKKKKMKGKVPSPLEGSKSNIVESVSLNKVEQLKSPKSALNTNSSFVEPLQEENPENFVVMPPVNNHVLLVAEKSLNEEHDKVQQLLSPVEIKVEDRSKSLGTGEIMKSGQLNEAEKLSEDAEDKLSLGDDYDDDDDGIKISRDERKTRTILKSAGHKSGSVSSKTTSSLGIFSIITKLQGKYPDSVLKMFFSMTVEFIMMIIYCACFYTLSSRYISTQFEPLRSAMGNFGSIGNGFSMAITVSVEFHFRMLNMTSIERDTLNYLVILNKTTARAFDLVSHSYFDETDNDLTLEYQKIFNMENLAFTDTTRNLVTEYPGRFLLIDLLELLYKLKMDIHISKEMCELAPRNFFEVIRYIKSIRRSIENEFFNTNSNLQSIFLMVFIICVIFSLVLRFWDFLQLTNFYKEIMKIINIFLRISTNDITAEILMLRDVIKLFESSENNYMNVSFPNMQFSGRYNTISLLSEDPNLAGGSSQRKKMSLNSPRNAKKVHSRKQAISIRPPILSRKILVLVISYILVFSFFIGIYLYWNDINTDVKNLINTNIFIADIFSIPNTLLASTMMILENKLIENHSDFNEIRQTFLEVYHEYHLLSITLEQYIFLESKTQEQQSIYQNIMKNDLCKTVEDLSEDEYQDCRTVLNMAFSKGLIVGMNEMEGFLSLEEYYNVEEDVDIRDINELLHSDDHFGVVKAAFYLNKAMDRFRQLSEEFYRDDTLLKIDNLKIMILVITLIMAIVHLIEMYLTFKHLREIYRELLILLKFLPYNKLIKDDQIKFLIRNLK